MMRWTTLLKDIKDKVGLGDAAALVPPPQTQQPSSAANSHPHSSSSSASHHHLPVALAPVSVASGGSDASSSSWVVDQSPSASPGFSPARGKHELELAFRRYWEEFRASTSEKEKETALGYAVEVFCRLVRQQSNVAQVVNKLVESHIFCFVLGRAFEADVKKLRGEKIKAKEALNVSEVMSFFTEVTNDGICPGSNILYAVEVLVTGPTDKQHLLDTGILGSLVYILQGLLSIDESYSKESVPDDGGPVSEEKQTDSYTSRVRRLEIEGSVVHIMKALASHPLAAQCMAEDGTLELLFHIVSNGSLNIFFQLRQGLVPLHTVQLYRHAMQILGLVLVNDNGSLAKYIRDKSLIKCLLMAIKDFNPEKCDAAYTMGIVDLLLECVELSHRSGNLFPIDGGSGSMGPIKLRDEIHNAHGYQFLVQFALTLSNIHKKQSLSKSPPRDNASNSDDFRGTQAGDGSPPPSISPALSRLLDVLVNLSQTGPPESRSKTMKGGWSRPPSLDRLTDEVEKGSSKVKDLEAIQMLQDIFLKADNTEVQLEVLNRMFKIFSSHLENYKLCQELRTVPLFILNMAGFPSSLQEIILKILEYAVTVVNCIPEQELLSLCCLLQQPIRSSLRHTILSFFVKLLSFDQQYKKVLREVGVLEVLLDDLKQHKILLGFDQNNKFSTLVDKKSNSLPAMSGFQKHIDGKDVILSSPKLVASASAAARIPIFEDEGIIAVAWDCLFHLLKRAETNQQAFRAANGVSIVQPFLTSDSHRSGVLRLLSCLIIEDAFQAHPEELGGLIEIVKSGMVTSMAGSQYKLQDDAKCDILGALWRILSANVSAQRVFGEATGFSLLLTMLHGFQSDAAKSERSSSLQSHARVFTFLLRVTTAGVCNNHINRIRVHNIISSHTFYDLLCESGLLSVDCEKQVIFLLLELALEIVNTPTNELQQSNATDDEMSAFSVVSLGISRMEKERVYNASAIAVLIRALLLFTPRVQLDLLGFIENLASAGPFNQENLCSVGCVGLLLETISPFLDSSSPILNHVLRIVEVLGAYRLSSSELRLLVRYILQLKAKNCGNLLVCMMEKLIQMEDLRSQMVSLGPFVEMDMTKSGHASIQVSLGERTWPPASGYSFVCWFQFRNLFKFKELEPYKATGRRNVPNTPQILRLFSVSSVDDWNTLFAELYLHETGVFTLATSNSSSLSIPGLEIEEGTWHHLAVVHSKPNALAGLFQASVAQLYIDGKLRHTGKLGYAPSPTGRSLQVTLGTPAARGRVSELAWKLRSCYLFEEVLTPGAICLMYILGQGYRGLFQDSDLLQFVPNQACGGEAMAILNSLDIDPPSAASSSSSQRNASEGSVRGGGGGGARMENNGIVWDYDRLRNLASQITGKKLIFAFDGTCSDAFRTSGTLSLLNLVDPTSASASPIGGIPRFGRLSGDVYICHQLAIGDSMQTVGGMAVVLALVEAATTREMLHMALELLALSLHQNQRNMRDMQNLRGYHLLALFLHRRMSLFDMQSLEIFFRIAACEASFPEQPKSIIGRTASFAAGISAEAGLDDISLPKFSDDSMSVGSHGEDSFSHLSELENNELSDETSNCIVLSNPDMVEHVLLDWTLWVTAPISIQITLLNFLERMVSMHGFRNHNLTILRQINLVQHLLVTLQRGDVEVPVLEKLVVLLGVILEDGFLNSELELVVKFVTMTFDPPPRANHQVVREAMGKHIIVRNMLLEMLIELQVTIKPEELLEQWHKIVSSRLIAFFLDEAVHSTSMRWIMTLTGVCLSSSLTFVQRFRASLGFQGLARVLPNFFDSPEIYYILFCLIFGKSVYPRVPEVRMLDFHALMPSDGNFGELQFVELLETVVAMAKAAFDRLSLRSMLAYQNGNLSHLSGSLASDLFVETSSEIAGGDLQGEALMHKTYAARLMSGEAAAPAVTTSVLRFMVDLAKMCPPFSAACRRAEFLENCVDLYFSCVRADCALRMAKDLQRKATTDIAKVSNDIDDIGSSKDTFTSVPADHELSAKTSMSLGSAPQEQNSTYSDEPSGTTEATKSLNKEDEFEQKQDQGKIVNKNVAVDISLIDESPNSASLNLINSPILSEKSNSKTTTPLASPVGMISSWLTGSSAEKPPLAPSVISSVNDSELSAADPKLGSHGTQLAGSLLFPINSHILLEMDDMGYDGGPCSAGATAVLDFVAQILADIIAEQVKAHSTVENILESVPLFVDAESLLVFQGLCLGRVVNFLERRLLRDDDEDNFKKLDKAKWSVNLDALCYMIVDRVYMGSFPMPLGVLRTLEFLLSMLQLANKDGRIEEVTPSGKGLLSITRSARMLEGYIYSILKNTNRMIMYCFLPTYLASIGEDEVLSGAGFQTEPGRYPFAKKASKDGVAIDICTVLQLLIANKRLILCPSNLDKDVICCLLVNLIVLLRDKRLTAQNLAIDLMKYLLLHRRQMFEEMLMLRADQGGQVHDVLRGGFDKLLTGSVSMFFEWFNASDHIVNRALDQCASIMWHRYITDSYKFPGVRIKGFETRRKRDMGRRSKETVKLDEKHWELMDKRRDNLEEVRNNMSTLLRKIRQDKYGWVLHAESEWQDQLQQLVHERGIFPVRQSFVQHSELQQLCPVEGPYRMRKKLERCKFRADTIQSLLKSGLCLEEDVMMNNEEPQLGFGNNNNNNNNNGADDLGSGLNGLLSDDVEQKETDGAASGFYEGADEEIGIRTEPNSLVWNDDRASSINEPSLHSAMDLGAGKSSVYSAQITDSIHPRSETGSPRASSVRTTDLKTGDEKPDSLLFDNGEYLIRPFLEPSEAIKQKYNCERVLGLDKHDGIFIIGELCLYIIENFYIDESGCICEKASEDETSVIDRALGVKRDVITGGSEFSLRSPSSSFRGGVGASMRNLVGGRAWAYNGGAWGKEKVCSSSTLPHPWHMWKLDSVHELLKRDYQLRPVAIEIFSMDGCNDLIVFHKKEREEVFRHLITMNLPRNSMLDTTISGSSKQEANEGGRLSRFYAKSFMKRWQNGEISNFQYLMHLNTLAGRGYSDLTQYPVFPWVLSDYESEELDLLNPQTFRRLDKPMGCQTPEGEEEFRKRYESWDDPDVPKFHYGSHYSSAGIVLFYLLRLPPFSGENQKLQGGSFDHADRLFNSVRDTWHSAAGKSNTSDVKELIPEFYYMPEFLENRFNLDLGEKQSGEKVGDVILPPWARGSAREFIRKHREALESDYVSENLHHWIDLIFGHKQRGKAAEDAVNVFYHYTYEGNVDIDAVTDPTMKASILAQINHFGQTPKQLFTKPHVQRRTDRKIPSHPLRFCTYLVPQEARRTTSSISQIVTFNDKTLTAGVNCVLKPINYAEYVSWGFPDKSLRVLSYDQEKLLSTHENLHGGNQIQCGGVSHDGTVLVTGADDGTVSVWRFVRDGLRGQRNLLLERTLCAHTAKITCLFVSQPYSFIVTGSDDSTVIIWDLTNLVFVRQLPRFPSPISVVHVNNLTGEIITAAGVLLSVWSINGDCLAVINTSQLPSDMVLSVACTTSSDWLDTNWYVTGHQSGAVKVWKMVHFSSDEASVGGKNRSPRSNFTNLGLNGKLPEYRLILQKVLKAHKQPVTALCLTSDLKQLLSGDSRGHLVSWTLQDEGNNINRVS